MVNDIIVVARNKNYSKNVRCNVLNCKRLYRWKAAIPGALARPVL